MTRDKILAMEAGRELDALVAEKVMEKPMPIVAPLSDELFLDTYDDWGGAWTVRGVGAERPSDEESVGARSDKPV
jgi:hypothetical protein